MERKYIDLRRGTVSSDIGLLFPDWESGNERVAVLGPHDDDPLIGAGYALAAAADNGAELYAVLFCKGDCGYSKPEEKDSIVSVRRAENERAMTSFGIPPEHILRLEYPDFSLMHHLGAELANGDDGVFRKMMHFIRDNKITRLLVPNGYYEHIDHTAVYLVGAYDAIQAGDAILADYGAPQKIKTYLQYSVWADFSPQDAMLAGETAPGIRANRAILCDPAIEKRIFDALGCYASQHQIIADLMLGRRERDTGAGYLELYIDFDPRPKLHYRPYTEQVTKLLQSNTEE